jgi:hypothetical protein
MNEAIFLVEQAPEGGYAARALGLSIFVPRVELVSSRVIGREKAR